MTYYDNDIPQCLEEKVVGGHQHGREKTNVFKTDRDALFVMLDTFWCGALRRNGRRMEEYGGAVQRKMATAAVLVTCSIISTGKKWACQETYLRVIEVSNGRLPGRCAGRWRWEWVAC